MSRPIFADGDAVRIIRTVRDDGTYPGASRGDVLIRRGHVGYVCDIGVFLQDQIIYSVHFLEAGGRIIGCRGEELIPADAPWNPSRFERGDRVQTRLALGIQGQVLEGVARYAWRCAIRSAVRRPPVASAGKRAGRMARHGGCRDCDPGTADSVITPSQRAIPTKPRANGSWLSAHTHQAHRHIQHLCGQRRNKAGSAIERKVAGLERLGNWK